MLIWSISRTDAAPTPTATARARMIGARRSRCPADRVGEEVELPPPGDAVPDDFDLLDPRAVDLERALDADARRDPPNRDRARDPAAAQAHDGPFEDLNALARSLDDLGRDLHGV